MKNQVMALLILSKLSQTIDLFTQRAKECNNQIIDVTSRLEYILPPLIFVTLIHCGNGKNSVLRNCVALQRGRIF